MLPAARIVRLSALVALALIAVWLFLPTTLGGGTTYVSTRGTSMQPRFHTGDLAILRPAGVYEVGDVVAYQSAELGTVVMHRIVGREGDTFQTRGDNNSWIDPDHVATGQILGRLWLRVPHGGTALAALKSPMILGPIAGAATLVVAAIGVPRRRRRKPVRTAPEPQAAVAAPAVRPTGTVADAPAPATTHARPWGLPTATRARARQVALGAAVATALGAVGCGALLVLPDTRTESRAVTVQQQGEFGYSGSAVAGTTYPTGAITTGDPIYTRLVSRLTVSFRESFTAPAGARLDGTVRLDVGVVGQDGWRAVVTTGAEVPVRDGVATATVPLDPARAAELLARHNAETGGGSGRDSAILTVTPVSHVTGTVDGQPFTAKSLTGIQFGMDASSLRATGDEKTRKPAASTQVGASYVAPRTIPVLGLTVTVVTARRVAGAVLIVALVVVLGSAMVSRGRRGDAADAFLLRHSARVLPVAGFTPGATVIDVAEPEALNRVAERLDGLVLHHSGEDADTFAVQDGDTTYRCVVPRVPETVHVERRVSALPPVPAGAVRNRFA